MTCSVLGRGGLREKGKAKGPGLQLISKLSPV